MEADCPRMTKQRGQCHYLFEVGGSLVAAMMNHESILANVIRYHGWLDGETEGSERSSYIADMEEDVDSGYGFRIRASSSKC